MATNYTKEDMGGGCEALRGVLLNGWTVIASYQHRLPEIGHYCDVCVYSDDEDPDSLVTYITIENYTGPECIDAAIATFAETCK